MMTTVCAIHQVMLHCRDQRHTRRRRYLLITLSLPFTAFANGAPQLGLGYQHTSAVFAGAEDPDKLVPVVRYRGKNITIDGMRLDWRLYGQQRWQTGIGFNVDTTYDDRNDAPALEAWPHLSSRINAHVFLKAALPAGIRGRLALSQDTNDIHHGATVSLTAQRPYPLNNVTVIPSIGLAWSNDKRFEHVFAVDGSFEPQSTLDTHIGLSMVFPLNRRITLMASAHWHHLDNAITDLPFIDEQACVRAMAAVLYRFKPRTRGFH